METLKSLRIKAKDAGIKYYYRMCKQELISALFLKGINPYDNSLTKPRIVIFDDIYGSITYDEAIRALADVYPEKRKRLFIPSPFSKFRKMFISILKKCSYDILFLIQCNNISPITRVDYINGHHQKFLSRLGMIYSLAESLEWLMSSVFISDDDSYSDSIMKIYDGKEKCRLQVLWLSKKTGKDYTSMKKS